MKKNRVFSDLLLVFCLLIAFMPSAIAQLPTQEDVQASLTVAKESKTNVANQILVQNLEDTLDLLQKIEQQKENNKNLTETLKNTSKTAESVQSAVENLKNLSQPVLKFDNLSIDELQTKLIETEEKLNQIQMDLAVINDKLASQRSASDKTQNVLKSNIERAKQIEKLLAQSEQVEEKNKLKAELVLLNLQNVYNQTLLKGNNSLISLYALQSEEKSLISEQLEKVQIALQTAINEKNLQGSYEQEGQIRLSQNKGNPIIAEQRKLNLKASQALVKYTAHLNKLTQDNTRIKNVLDNLQRTDRNISDQISNLQGTLVLSRIITKQKQSLPQNQMVRGLAKQIADLRVKIFDLTERRDRLYDIKAVIAECERKSNQTLTAEERSELTTVLQERRKLLSDGIAILNNQLNLAINIELNQQQVAAISDTLQQKLQQQSFWVRSNPPIDLDWFSEFLPNMDTQLTNIKNEINFSNWKDNIVSATSVLAALLVIILLVLWQKEKIKRRLSIINSRIYTVQDRHLYTPEAVFWTIILCLPSTLLFLSVLILVTFVCFQSPTQFWWWSISMAGYWWFFAFILAMLRPNGLAYRHFKMSQESVKMFQSVFKRSVWICALWLNASIFTHLDSGISNDVVGEILTTFILIISLFIIAPRIRSAVQIYKKSQLQSAVKIRLLNITRVLLILIPILLIVLIIMGYYYTTLNLMAHLMSSYFVITSWMIVKEIIYRSSAVSSRHLSENRIQACQQESQTIEGVEDDIVELVPEEHIELSKAKNQVKRVVDSILWFALAALLYWVWSDLVGVVYYLQSVTLWTQSTITDSGVITESITLLNLLLAIAILVVTYFVVRNIAGVLEVLLFSRITLSQGTPYTITTLVTYIIIAIGAGIAFSTLGMSWSKLQWLFAALSVGLGFGLQEIFANFISGIIILFERPIRVGDVVTIDNYTGTVTKIRIRSTTIIDGDKKEIIIPNKAFVTGRIINWVLTDQMTRIVIKIGVAYGSNLELVRQLLLQAATDCELVMRDPAPSTYFLGFGASTLDHDLRVFVPKLGDRMKATDFLNRRINQLFAENNIEIAFNQLDVFIKNQVTSEEVKLTSEKSCA